MSEPPPESTPPPGLPDSPPPSGSEAFDLRRTMLILLIGSLCIGALFAIVAITGGGEFDETGAKALGTAAALSVYSLAALACNSLGHKRAELALLGAVGTIVAGVSLLITVGEIWFGGDVEGAWRAIGISLVLTLALAHICLLMRRDPSEEGNAAGLVRLGTVGVIVLLASLLVVEIGSEGDEVGAQTLGVVSVLYVLGTLLLPLVRVLESGERR